MKTINLRSKSYRAGHIPNTFTEQHIKNETMLFSADYDFARKNGDMITQLFLDKLPATWRHNVVIDSRVHMLMPGWCPCIPGWHHDDVPRSRSDGQPNYIDPHYYAEHMLMLINADTAPTQFLDYEGEFFIPEPGRIIYEDWNNQINNLISDSIPAGRVGDRTVEVTAARDGDIMIFDWQTFHRGIPALHSGWRYFIRISRYWKDKAFMHPDTDRLRRRALKNEIRRQVQVYLPDFEKGW